MSALAAVHDDRLARVALSRLTEPGDPRVSRLVPQLGAPRLLHLLLDDPEVSDLSADAAGRMIDVEPERELEQAARQGIRFVVPGDTEWPGRTADLVQVANSQDRGGPPLGLWVRGPRRLDELGDSLAVVGSRSATTYGADVASEIAAVTARAGWGVVSGAAFGIDQAAHRGAAAVRGLTVAVLACGVDRAYPAAHAALLEHLAAEGMVVSELPPGCAPTRLRFLTRNRVIAALTRGTVVVEAAIRSGALSTANWASKISRPVLGVPGPVTSAQSQGVHGLLRTGAATLVTCGAEVLEELGAVGEHLAELPRGPERPRDRLSSRQQQVLDAVPVASPAGVESVARTAGIGLLEVSTLLAQLQSLELVEQVPRGWRLAEGARS
jgi:DNA processing protein